MSEKPKIMMKKLTSKNYLKPKYEVTMKSKEDQTSTPVLIKDDKKLSYNKNPFLEENYYHPNIKETLISQGIIPNQDTLIKTDPNFIKKKLYEIKEDNTEEKKDLSKKTIINNNNNNIINNNKLNTNINFRTSINHQETNMNKKTMKRLITENKLSKTHFGKPLQKATTDAILQRAKNNAKNVKSLNATKIVNKAVNQGNGITGGMIFLHDKDVKIIDNASNHPQFLGQTKKIDLSLFMNKNDNKSKNIKNKKPFVNGENKLNGKQMIKDKKEI